MLYDYSTIYDDSPVALGLLEKALPARGQIPHHVQCEQTQSVVIDDVDVDLEPGLQPAAIPQQYPPSACALRPEMAEAV
jgi:hypothetical protein